MTIHTTHANTPLRRLVPAILAALLLAPALTAAAQATGGVTGITPSTTPGTAPGIAPLNRIQPMQSAPAAIAPMQQPTLKPLPPQATLTPEMAQLIELDSRFAADVAKGGGKAFATWFADDAVILNNGEPPVVGHRAIADHAQWDPKEYQLSWQPEGAQLSPSGDMGFTWGHYQATTVHPAPGEPAQHSGRYITIWKKLPGGEWKVALDASANDAGQGDAAPPKSPAPAP